MVILLVILCGLALEALIAGGIAVHLLILYWRGQNQKRKHRERFVPVSSPQDIATLSDMLARGTIPYTEEPPDAEFFGEPYQG